MRIRRGRLLRAAARVGFADKRRVGGPNTAGYLSTTRYPDLVPELLEFLESRGDIVTKQVSWIERLAAAVKIT